MTQEKSRFTSDRRTPREASWVGESDWSVGTGENVAVDGGDLSPSLPQTTSGKALNGLVYDFEAGTVENWSYTTTHHGSSNWGVSSVAAPDGGEHAIFVSQNSGGGNSAEIYSGPVSYNWAQPYEFEFLVKSDGFKPTAGWLGVLWGGEVDAMRLIQSDFLSTILTAVGTSTHSALQVMGLPTAVFIGSTGNPISGIG